MNAGEYVLVEFGSHNIQAAVITETDREEQLVKVDNKRTVPHIVEWIPECKCKLVRKSTLQELGLL